ncbi:hypothetical protein ACFW04_013926 [Cataglyphis niger]
MDILKIYWGGIDDRVMLGERIGTWMDGEEGLSRNEIRSAIGRQKDNKAVGLDGIPAEVWKYGGESLEECVWRISNWVCKGEGWIDDWSEGMIVPILKKGEGERVEEYRRMSLTSTLYKVYASVLANILNDEEKKGLVPQNQTGFRKGLGTIDNIFILNYLVNRQLRKKKGKLVAFFIDLKAAFDSVDRRKLVEAMRERGVREGLVTRSEDILRETRNRVRRGEDLGARFWTGSGAH